MNGAMPGEVRLREEYPHPPAKVWRALTTPAVMAKWIGMRTDFEPRIGHRFTFRCDPDDPCMAEFAGQWDGLVRCEVVEVDPPRRLVYTWEDSWAFARQPRPTVVSWTLEASPSGGTRLTLEHTGFEGEGGRRLAAMLSGGWGGMLRDTLRSAIAAMGDES